MGAKIVTFRNFDGDEVRVSFFGDTVADAELTAAAAPAVLQMDGGGEYAAIKYTTASITVVVDGLQLMDLWASAPLSVKVKIDNVTTGKVLFSGYISPNTFSQPIDGVADQLAIEAVDSLGIAKCIPYKMLDETAGFAGLTLRDLLLQVASLIGVSDVYLADVVRLRSGNGTVETAAYELLEVAENYFFTEQAPRLMPNGTYALGPLAMTCYDVLEMVAASFRMTWVQQGEAIILIDDVQLNAGEASYRWLRPGAASLVGQYFADTYALDAEAIAATGANVGVYPTYSLYPLKHDKAESINVLLPLLEDASLSRVGSLLQDLKTTNAGMVYEAQMVQLLTSKYYNTGISTTPDGIAPSGMFLGHASLEQKETWSGGLYWYYTVWGDKRWDWHNYLRCYVPSNYTGNYTFCSLKNAFRVAMPTMERAGLKLSIEIGFGNESSKWYPVSIATSGVKRIGVVIKCGELYYNASNGAWTAERQVATLLFPEGDQWRTSYTLLESNPWWVAEEYLVTNVISGPISIELCAVADCGYKVAYVKSLALEVVPFHYAALSDALHPVDEVEYIGTYEYSREAEEVSLPMTFGFPMSPKPFGTTIDGVAYSSLEGVYPDIEIGAVMEFACAGTTDRYTMLERLQAMGGLTDGTEMQFAVLDAHNSAIMPTTVMTSSAWSGQKRVVAITRNIADCTAEITLN